MMQWTGDQLATLDARYATSSLDDLARVLGMSVDDIVGKAESRGLWRKPGLDDTLCRSGAERIAAKIAAVWGTQGVVVAPKLVSFTLFNDLCWTVRLPPVSATPHGRNSPKPRSRVRDDWPPGSNVALLRKQELQRRQCFFNGVLRRGSAI